MIHQPPLSQQTRGIILFASPGNQPAISPDPQPYSCLSAWMAAGHSVVSSQLKSYRLSHRFFADFAPATASAGLWIQCMYLLASIEAASRLAGLCSVSRHQRLIVYDQSYCTLSPRAGRKTCTLPEGNSTWVKHVDKDNTR